MSITVQMIFALSYVPCVAFQGMSLAVRENAVRENAVIENQETSPSLANRESQSKLYNKLSIFFGVLATCSYSVFLLKIIQ